MSLCGFNSAALPGTSYLLQVVNGRATPPEDPGIGVVFDWNKLAPFKEA